MILFTGGNLGVLFLSGTFVPAILPRIARNFIYSQTFVLSMIGKV